MRFEIDLSARQERILFMPDVYDEFPKNMLQDAKILIPLDEIDEIVNRVPYVLSTIPERERTLMLEKYRDDCTLKELSERYKVSRERIGKLIRRGLNYLRKPAQIEYLIRGDAFAVNMKKMEKEYAAKQKELEELNLALKKEIEKKRLELKLIKSEKKLPEEDYGDLNAIPIDEIGFNMSIYNAFKSTSDFRYVTDFIGKSEDDILNLKGIGKASVKEIKVILEKYGVQLLPGKYLQGGYEMHL